MKKFVFYYIHVIYFVSSSSKFFEVSIKINENNKSQIVKELNEEKDEAEAEAKSMIKHYEEKALA